VRGLAIVCLSWLCLPASWAQQQEPSLVDRLLRPNLELQNNAQDKKFVANSAVIERRGTVGTFLLQPNRVEKSVVNTHAVTTTQYVSRSLNTDSRASGLVQNQSANVPAATETSSARDIHDAPDSRSAIASRSFAGQRQFREQGKSQKSLDRQNPPMTIDQVRELLNKNK
jgi:hypothetical protein